MQAPYAYDDGYFRVEYENYFVSCGNQRLLFSRSEFLVLSSLAKNADRVVRAEDIWDEVWDGRKPFNPRSLKISIFRVRKKLRPFGLRIENLIGVGYRLVRSMQAKFSHHPPQAGNEINLS